MGKFLAFSALVLAVSADKYFIVEGPKQVVGSKQTMIVRECVTAAMTTSAGTYYPRDEYYMNEQTGFLISMTDGKWEINNPELQLVGSKRNNFGTKFTDKQEWSKTGKPEPKAENKIWITITPMRR